MNDIFSHGNAAWFQRIAERFLGTGPGLERMEPRLTVIGVGGAGGNAVNNMIASHVKGVDFITANTDAQALAGTKAKARVQIGRQLTEGLGAGSQPQVGKKAAEESIDEIMEYLGGSHMVFITAGMGGGTGTGAAPVIAKTCREAGILTVGVVSTPFAFEGAHRMKVARAGVKSLEQSVDTILVIPNENLFRITNEETTVAQAFLAADRILTQGVRGITDLMVNPGHVNLDFADIRTVISEMGYSVMGSGYAKGEDRAYEAARRAIVNPLVSDACLKGAKGVVVNITGSSDLKLAEIDEAVGCVLEEVAPDANLIFGSSLDSNMDGLRVTVFGTGLGKSNKRAKTISANSKAREAKSAGRSAPSPKSNTRGSQKKAA